MARYIDAEQLSKKILDVWENIDAMQTSEVSRTVSKFLGDVIVPAIVSTPDADVNPIVRGKWIEASKKAKVGKKCSNCGARIRYSEAFNGNHLFCHKCGADMRGDNNAKL